MILKVWREKDLYINYKVVTIMITNLSEILRIYNNRRMSIGDILNRPIGEDGEFFDPLVDLLGESWFGETMLERIEGYVIEMPVARRQTLLLPQKRDVRTYFKIEKGRHEWIHIPDDGLNRELNLRHLELNTKL